MTDQSQHPQSQQPPMPPQQPASGQYPPQPPQQQGYQQPQQQPQYQQPQNAQGYPPPEYQQQPQYPYAGQPMPQQAAPMPQAQETKKHVHHTYIWASGINVAFAMLIAFGFAFFPMLLSDEIPSYGAPLVIVGIILGTLLIVGLTIGIQAISYKYIYYEIGEKEFSLYSGIFNKKQVHVPYQRVQSVNQKAGLVQRILGVCTVNIDTAGGASNKAVVVPYILNTEAERLRTELFARKQLAVNGGQQAAGAPQAAAHVVAQGRAANVLDAPAEIMSDVRGVFGGDQLYTGQVSFEYGLSNKELILTGLSNNTGFVLMVLALIGGAFGLVSQFVSSGIGNKIYNEGVAFATRTFADNFVWFIVGIVLLVMAVLWVFSIIGTCISYGGFKANRRDSRIEVQQGLLQHHFHGVDIDRVQSVIIKQSFIRRLIGYCELSLGKIDAVSETSQDQENNVQLNRGLIIHPFVKMDRVPEILAGLVPEFADVPTEPIMLPSVSLRRAIIRRGIFLGNGFWLALIAAITQLICNFVPFVTHEIGSEALYWINVIIIAVYALCAIIAIVEIVNAVLWFRGSSFAYNNSFMQVTNGGFSRESITFPRKKIQYGFTRTNPFQRLSRVVTINARTAAGIGGTTMKLLDVHEEDADTWMEWLKPRQSVVK